MKKRILVTGAAGFIGFHLSRFLNERGDFVIGIDNFNSYYDPGLKQQRKGLLEEADITVITGDVCDQTLLTSLLTDHEITHVVHLAAQAGVRYSFVRPHEYVSANLQGFVSLLEACRSHPNVKLVFASSSSVYGLNKTVPFRVDDRTDLPANLYGATKKANEVMAFSYHHLYGIPMVGLRFFTVYGPWGRPDMAYFHFADQICAQKPIRLFNQGLMRRDFTYIDDIVRGTAAAIDHVSSYELFNLGNARPVDLLYMVELLEQALGKKALKELVPMQQGEAVETCADIETSKKTLGYEPSVPLEEGILRFVEWYKTR